MKLGPSSKTFDQKLIIFETNVNLKAIQTRYIYEYVLGLNKFL